MNHYELLPLSLRLFDGEGGAEGDAQAAPELTQRGKKAGEYDNVVFGKQPEEALEAQNAPDAGEQKADVIVTSDTREEQRRKYQELVQGELKEFRDEEFQQIFNRRFKDYNNLKERVDKAQPVLDMLTQRYGLAEGDMAGLQAALESDNAYWQEAADAAGMDVEQFRQFQRLQRENQALLRAEEQRRTDAKVQQQLFAWQQEAQQVKGKHPEFDLTAELRNRNFVAQLKSGVPMELAYLTQHYEEKMQSAMSYAAATTEKQVVDNVRAKGQRPAENGASSRNPGFVYKTDPREFTKKDRAEVARRAARGEIITF